jgi:hypothetical protein
MNSCFSRIKKQKSEVNIWGINLLGIPLLFFSHLATASELTLHFIPAPTRTDWSSPQALASSALKNQFVKYKGGSRHSIGHLYVELSCQTGHFFTGTTSTGNAEERIAILFQGYGLGIVLKNFMGKLDASFDAEMDVKSLQAVGRSTFVKFLISESTCQRLTDYWFEYQRKGYHQIYAGLNARPLYGESAGCTAFGASFLELAGLLDLQFVKEWKSQFVIPRKYVGGPITGKRVSFLKVLMANRSKWDEDFSHDGIALDFWDPEKMVEWTRLAVEKINHDEKLDLPWSAKAVQSDLSVGVEFDASWVTTPTGPYFYNN